MRQVKRDYVAAGSAVIVDRQSQRDLVALLGSCVAVAMVDARAGVGGVIHLLLPEPPEFLAGIDAMIYARTGLPLFIEELRKKGAEKERIEATVAGGALTTPVSFQDLNLDIGGRLAEVVLSLLMELGIRIVRTETGGVTGTCLRLEAESLKPIIEPVLPRRENVAGNDAALLGDRDIVRAMEATRPVPQVVLRLLRLLDREDHSLGEISGELARDQVLGAKVLRLCNSALYGMPKKIDSLDRAILLLGEHLIREMVLAVAMREIFEHHEGGYSLMRGGLFHHSYAVGVASRLIATMSAEVEPSLAFTAGLLHDIGKVVLDTHLARARPFFYRDSEGMKTLNELERQHLGIDHAEAGRRLAERWGLPASLEEVISRHHEPEPTGEFVKLIAMVQLANCIVASVLAVPDRLAVEEGAARRMLDILGLSPEILPRVVAGVPWAAIISL